MGHREASFDRLVAEAASVPLRGWDFSWLDGRTDTTALPWDYRALAASVVAQARRVLDVDTGGGEIFSVLGPPPGSVALEAYEPNVAVAAARLAPLGVEVRRRDGRRWPVDPGAFDLVLNRHGRLDPDATWRALTPGGLFLSQQVGRHNDLELNEALGLAPHVDDSAPSTVEGVQAELRAAGFDACEVEEAITVTRYLDIGAVVFQLRAVPWQAPGFDAERHRAQLLGIHRTIEAAGGFEVRSQRFLIRARRPDRL